MDDPTGIFGQLGRTRGALLGLGRAHIALLRAEIGEIVRQIKGIAALAAVLLVFALMTNVLLYVGGFLFLGEWLFGSIGWGLAHGVLFGIGLIVVLTLAILGAPARRAFVALGLAVLAMIGLALLAGLNIGYDTAAYLATQLASPFNSPGVVALLGGGLVGSLLLMVLLLFAGGIGGALAGLFGGLFLGALIGWLLAGAPWTWPPAAGFGIAIGLLLWPMLAAALAWRTIDIEARFGGLYPRRSIDAAQETRAWLEEQWQTKRPKI